MSGGAREAPYTLRTIRSMLGLGRGRGVVEGLIRAGFVVPQRGPRNEMRFTFQDVLLLRTAHELRLARVSPRRLLRALERLKARLPADAPLTGQRLRAFGREVGMRNAAAQWESDTGQLLIDFEPAPGSATARPIGLRPRSDRPASGAAISALLVDAVAGPHIGTEAANGSRMDAPAPPDDDRSLTAAQALEADDAPAAESAYRRLLASAPDDLDTVLTLGVLLCATDRCAEACVLYDRVLATTPDEPLLHFNRAIALEDAGHERAAIEAYARCLVLAPDLADAHYNAARVHERLAEPQAALRHYNAYRRLQR